MIIFLHGESKGKSRFKVVARRYPAMGSTGHQNTNPKATRPPTRTIQTQTHMIRRYAAFILPIQWQQMPLMAVAATLRYAISRTSLKRNATGEGAGSSKAPQLEEQTKKQRMHAIRRYAAFILPRHQRTPLSAVEATHRYAMSSIVGNEGAGSTTQSQRRSRHGPPKLSATLL